MQDRFEEITVVMRFHPLAPKRTVFMLPTLENVCLDVVLSIKQKKNTECFHLFIKSGIV